MTERFPMKLIEKLQAEFSATPFDVVLAVLNSCLCNYSGKVSFSWEGEGSWCKGATLELKGRTDLLEDSGQYSGEATLEWNTSSKHCVKIFLTTIDQSAGWVVQSVQLGDDPSTYFYKKIGEIAEECEVGILISIK